MFCSSSNKTSQKAILIFVTFCEWAPEYPKVCIRHNLRAITWRSDTKPQHYIRIIILQASYRYSDCEILSATRTHIPCTITSLAAIMLHTATLLYCSLDCHQPS